MSYLHKVDCKTAITYFLFTHCLVKEQEPQNLGMSAPHFHSWRNIGGSSWQQHITITILHITWAGSMIGGECFPIWIFLSIKVLSKNYIYRTAGWAFRISFGHINVVLLAECQFKVPVIFQLTAVNCVSLSKDTSKYKIKYYYIQSEHNK